ncbi:ABC transporter permease [Natrinema soli]|uniref:ABC transporter permease n=1 Tax=Natrinema soli TaxID=1930624 RepID=A0ABD5SM89_9EURY|nr:ABC transporter permease [Natrinema soli]
MTLRTLLIRARAIAGLGVAQLRHTSGRTALAVGGVMLAVLAVTLLTGLGLGVVETGQEKFDAANRDIWITGGPAADATTAENEVTNAPAIAANISERDDVKNGDVSVTAIHELYIGTEPTEVDRITAVGIQGTHAEFEFEAGQGFSSETYENYASADPADRPSNITVINPAIAERYDLDVGDTVYLGASRQQTQPYTVVGIGAYYSQYLGTPTLTLPLEELQTMTGTAGSDRASFITANIADNADREAVRDEIQAAYPAYDVQTSDDQFATLVGDRLLIVASGITLVGLAIVGGVTLTANLLVLVTYQQRESLAALRALGLSRWLLAGLIGIEGLIIGCLGGVLGLAATPLVARGLNHLSVAVFGFERIVRLSVEVYALGFVTALIVGTIVALITGWQASRSATMSALES